MAGLCEEIGDLLLIVTLLAQIGNEEGVFSMAEIIQGIHRKIVRRHPHVFGDVDIESAEGVLRNWEKLKESERRKQNKHEKKGILDGVSKTLPALTRAQEYQDRAAHVGFDWPAIVEVEKKVMEEWQEVTEANGSEAVERELGDLLFAVVNLVRWYKVDAETALRKANQMFYRRFRHIETRAAGSGKALTDLSLDEMEDLWQEAKQNEEIK
jgi:tetrapyrrole methylase family protein/MazG family protein